MSQKKSSQIGYDEFTVAAEAIKVRGKVELLKKLLPHIDQLYKIAHSEYDKMTDAKASAPEKQEKRPRTPMATKVHEFLRLYPDRAFTAEEIANEKEFKGFITTSTIRQYLSKFNGFAAFRGYGYTTEENVENIRSLIAKGQLPRKST